MVSFILIAVGIRLIRLKQVDLLSSLRRKQVCEIFSKRDAVRTLQLVSRHTCRNQILSKFFKTYWSQKHTLPWGCCWAGWPSPPSTPGRGRCYMPRPPVLSEWVWLSHWLCLLYLGLPQQQLVSPLSSDGPEQELKRERERHHNSMQQHVSVLLYHVLFLLNLMVWSVLLIIKLKGIAN